MEKVFELYQTLYDNHVTLLPWPILLASHEGSRAVVIMEEDNVGLFLDTERIQDTADETVLIAHEAGHIMTGSVHGVSSPFDLVAKHEHRAWKWAIKKLVPEDELVAAVEDGCTQPWELAERFSVTEDFMRKAICLYQNGNLDTYGSFCG